MRRTIVILLAITAVLCGAPSAALATDAGQAQAADPAPAQAGITFKPFEIAIGIGGIGGMALFGSFALLLRRRRRVASQTSGNRDDAPAPPTAEEQVTAALHRRTIRRGRVRMEEDDPIIAAMGVRSHSRAEPGVSRARRSARRSPPT